MVRMDWVPSQDGLRQILQLLKVDQPLVDPLVDHHLVDHHILNWNAGVPESRHSNTEGGAEET